MQALRRPPTHAPVKGLTAMEMPVGPLKGARLMGAVLRAGSGQRCARSACEAAGALAVAWWGSAGRPRLAPAATASHRYPNHAMVGACAVHRAVGRCGAHLPSGYTAVSLHISGVHGIIVPVVRSSTWVWPGTWPDACTGARGRGEGQGRRHQPTWSMLQAGSKRGCKPCWPCVGCCTTAVCASPGGAAPSAV
jgi:hypothetical protein